MRAELAKVAPGTRLREGLDMMISSRMGALIVVGEIAALEPLCSGGFAIDTSFTPQRLFELSKMDGAIVLDAECDRILKANVHLVPDASLPTSETGMRHRSAERISRQTSALAIAISHRRNVVNLYLRGRRVTLDEIDVLLAKANQAIQTLQNYRQRLAEMLERLTLLEFEDLVTLGDVAEVVGRFETVRRVAREVERYTLQLGTEGRLVKMQLDELTSGVTEQFTLVLRDYSSNPSLRKIAAVRDRLADLPPERIIEPDAIAHELGLTSSEHAELHLRPRGYRAMAQIPMVPGSVVARIVERFGTLTAIARASVEELDAVDGVGGRRAQAISSGLARVKAHVSV
ncbi:MAG: DNA integrity scanning protein DisA [Actinobacteria bacterium HGW-Actinobacteria-7]|nr:MAG: DNA integrity scanning protein DisA [Actinobacteria bacterium HGW-Actinobacteria-7]